MDNNEATYNNPIAEPEHKDVLMMSEEDKQFLKAVEWQKAEISEDQWLDINSQYVRPEYTLNFNGIPFAPLGGIHALTGQPGHGKTMTFSMFMAAHLGGHYDKLESEIKDAKVLYVDTEMEKCNTVLVTKRILEMINMTADEIQERLRVLRLRDELKAEDRWRKILKAIWLIRPDVVFIDGIIDITQDFNDNKECQDLIYQLLGTATKYNISLWCLLHQNPGSTKMVGHAGSFLERKATDVFMTKKNKEGGKADFEISQIKARGRDVDDIPFTIDDDEHHYGIPHLLIPETPTTKPTEKDETEDPQIVQNVLAVIGTDKKVSFTALRERIKKEHGIGSAKAASYIAAGVKFGMLTLSNNTYTANPEDLYEQPENKIPF